MAGLADEIKVDKYLNKDLPDMWFMLKNKLLNEAVTSVIEIKPTEALKYVHDMEGLFLSLDIDTNYILPHIIVNGYNSSRKYDGMNLNIKILDVSKIDLFRRQYINKKRKEKA